MIRIQLRIYTQPGEAQLFVNLQRKDGYLETIAATVDTGAALALLPSELMEIIDWRPAADQEIVIDQAGIAGQAFSAVEAFVTISLEDAAGNRTLPFEVPVWFAETTTPLIGFAGVLDRAILHLDMLQQLGWLEIEI
jgi:hypothetical protein